MLPAVVPQPTGFLVAGILLSPEEMDRYVTDPGNLAFERSEQIYYADLMIGAVRGEHHWMRHVPRRLQEVIEILSLMAPDQGRVNQDAEL